MEQSLVIAMVGMLGVGAQWVAWRTGWPAIVLMLAAGFLAGPVLGLFDPEHAFGELLDPMIAIGVALILFEGGLSLDFRELRHAGEGVWRLVLLGGPIAWVLGAFAAHSIGGLEWPVAILFAGILVVTGPTVVMPLLRQSSVKARPAAILKWEAIVNDPIGALFAVVSYEYFRAVAESPGSSLFEVVPPLIFAAIIAGLIGYVAAAAIAWAFPRGAIPEYLKVPVLLTSVIVVFVLSNQIEHEAGLVAVTVMGIALANMNISSLRSIHPFKQNIAVILIAGIFILLSASLEFEQLAYLNWNFGLFLLALLFLVRPATILLSLLGSSVPWNERLFLAWIAPRGIVLVAISGLFALRLEDIGYDGTALIGLSFAVVVATIVAHGFTIDLVARLLNLKGSNRPGILIVGSTPWTISLALMMQELKTPVMVVDASWQRLALARQKGLPFYHGEILNEATEHNLDLTPYAMLVAATENEAYNALVCNEFAHEIGRDTVFQLGDAVDDDDRHSLPSSIRGRALFETGFGVEDVNERLARGWVFRKTKLSEEFDFEAAQQRLPDAASMLLLVRDNGTIRFFTHAARPEPRAGDVIVSFAPPQERSAQDAAAKRDRKRNKTAEQGA
ncbi:sodium:proton antiporter [Erythrobacter sp. EhN03]|uniref:cation:proton antiporter n=1 Tax=Qipengyuania flava TaxID=192812 RepID=UPI0007F5469F|nr:sodium:proton antiporter [Qipengyuania flava]MBO9504283.1 sodium:proton antiporter [Qipengyuania flava]OAN83641.1 sodium:proton antiporter [Erythrobacter sp. EhN03]